MKAATFAGGVFGLFDQLLPKDPKTIPHMPELVALAVELVPDGGFAGVFFYGFDEDLAAVGVEGWFEGRGCVEDHGPVRTGRTRLADRAFGSSNETF